MVLELFGVWDDLLGPKSLSFRQINVHTSMSVLFQSPKVSSICFSKSFFIFASEQGVTMLRSLRRRSQQKTVLASIGSTTPPNGPKFNALDYWSWGLWKAYTVNAKFCAVLHLHKIINWRAERSSVREANASSSIAVLNLGQSLSRLGFRRWYVEKYNWCFS